jgi:uncharacterized BrkB/YihY/UPF0761 family membrane protein
MGLLAWLDFTALMILLGAQIDAEIERDRPLTLPLPAAGEGWGTPHRG